MRIKETDFITLINFSGKSSCTQTEYGAEALFVLKGGDIYFEYSIQGVHMDIIKDKKFHNIFVIPSLDEFKNIIELITNNDSIDHIMIYANDRLKALYK